MRFIIKPYRMHCINAAYIQMSHVASSVCLCVGQLASLVSNPWISITFLEHWAKMG